MVNVDAIDWHQPWHAPLLRSARRVWSPQVGMHDALNAMATQDALKNHRGLPLQFVPQERLPAGEAYEAFIDRTGGVPTRNNLHDYFNALVWLTYPRSKRALNAIQASELSRPLPAGNVDARIGAVRGKLRDRATIFDENAALLLCADTAFEQALRAHDWQTCFCGAARAGQAYEVRLFGHALLEKLVKPYKAITAHVWVLAVPPRFLGIAEEKKRVLVDRMLCRRLQKDLLSAAPTPLPVLGVPGWWQDQDPGFYADETVFRPKRRIPATK